MNIHRGEHGRLRLQLTSLRGRRALPALLILPAVLMLFALSCGGGEETEAARQAFENWDEALADTSSLWTQAAISEDSYVELNRSTTAAYAENNATEMLSLLPKARLSLDDQERLLDEIDAALAGRDTLADEMEAAIEALPEGDGKAKLREVDLVTKARRSNTLMREAVTAYRQQLELEYRIVDLFTARAEGRMDDAAFVPQFNDTRARSNEMGRLADERFSEASKAEQDTLGAASHLEQP